MIPTLIQQAESAALASGYRRDPNHIWTTPSTGHEWYPGAAGLPEHRPFRVFIGDDHLPSGIRDMPQDTWPIGVYSHVYGQPCTMSLAMRFQTWGTYLLWCIETGRPSLPGMPAFLYGD